MRLGDILVARGLVSLDGIEKATARQKTAGGRLGDNLIALGLITAEQLDAIMHATPTAPTSIAELGVTVNTLLSLLMKFMYLQGKETPFDLSDCLKLPISVVNKLIEDAGAKKLVQATGSTGMVGQLKYALTERGRATALEAIQLCQYIGPAPVALARWQEQIQRQRITNERTDQAAFRENFSGLIVPDAFLRKIGPAVNAGRSILLYGPPGNGKTSFATRISSIFKDVVYIPYAVEIDGLIMQVFDSSLHTPAMTADAAAAARAAGDNLRREDLDRRWVACKRPVVIVGGELTLDMLDLRWNETARFYEAPLHVKALNGTFIIDDFGRQLVSPDKLLNRWIVPMESRIDFMKLHTGKSFQIPFDELVMFSTNLAPADLMDPAFLRRIPYKIELNQPSREEYRQIFGVVAEKNGLVFTDQMFEFIMDQLTVKNSYVLAYYQPKFICEQAVSYCKYANEPPHFTPQIIIDALNNLYVRKSDIGPTSAKAH